MTNKDRLQLITDNDLEYPIVLRLKVIPDWDLLYTHQQNRCREIAEAQAIFTREQTLQEVGEWLEKLSYCDSTMGYMAVALNDIAQLKSGVMPKE